VRFLVIILLDHNNNQTLRFVNQFFMLVYR